MRDPEFATDFDIFWAAYPSVRRMAKKDALKAWRKLAPNTETVQKIIDALAWQQETDQWKRGIIPLPATYLRGERFEDERPSRATQTAAPLTPSMLEQMAYAQRRDELIASGLTKAEAMNQIDQEREAAS